MTTTEAGPGAGFFQFAPEHDELRSATARFAERFRDDYLELSRSDDFPWDLSRALGRTGLLGYGVSEESGGQGGHGPVGRVFAGVVVEELGNANFYLAMLFLPATVSGQLLEQHLPAHVAARWLPGLVSGELTLGVGVTEPVAGSDVSGIAARAVRADGGWRLSGEKNSVTHAPHAAGFLVFAKTTPDAGSAGVTAFLVPADSAGVQVQPFRDAGWRPLGRGAVVMDDVFVPHDHVLGPVDGGFRVIMRGFDYSRSLIGLVCVGAARRALDATLEYVSVRRAFGRPVAENQGVSFPLAEHATAIEAARWLCYRTLALSDAGLPHTKEAAMVKWWVPRVAIDAVRECVVLNGHGGYSEDLPYQALLRDLSGFELGDGTPQVQKSIIARELLRGRSTTVRQ